MKSGKRKRFIHFGAALLLSLAATAAAHAQARPLPSAELPRIYDRLLKQIDRIPIYDDHSHATFPDDSDMDAMASPPDESTVMRLRDTNPEFVAAAKALFGYPYDDFKPEHAKWLIDKKKAAEAAGGTAYWDSILDKMNIETCLANRVALASATASGSLGSAARAAANHASNSASGASAGIAFWLSGCMIGSA